MADERKAISKRAADLVRAVRGSSDPRLMEVFLSAYGLSTKEGVALMKEKHLGRVLQPKMCSGYAMSMRSHVDVIAAIAEGCSATAWGTGAPCSPRG